MKIKMKVSMSGPAHNLSVGDEAEFDTAEAVRLIQAGMAVPVRSEEYENAMLKGDAEKAVAEKSALAESATATAVAKRKIAEEAVTEALSAEKTADEALKEKDAADAVLQKIESSAGDAEGNAKKRKTA